ncbi:MAG: AMP-dependent synthetase [Acidobacteria bacterium]|nr:MAG: AMP-dependent synthetase [Acidobacteriota bacterium]
MQVEEFLERSAVRFPGQTALVCGDRRLTYAQVEEGCNRLAHALVGEGVRPGDRVAIHLDNSVEAVLSVFAILKAGAVFLVVNATTKADKLAYILNNCRATALITDSRKLDAIEEGSAQTPHLRTVFVAGERASARPGTGLRSIALEAVLQGADRPVPPPAKRRIDIDLAALIYTSGSTGRPKGVMLTHLNVVSAATSITTYLESVPDDVVLCVLPLSFDYGLYQVLMAFKVGATLVLERSFTYPHAVLETLIRERVTGFPIVPTMAAVLLQLDLGRYDLSRLRYVTNTAAALPTHHIRRLRALFPDVKLYSMYGLTECKRVSYLPPDQIDVRPGSVGRGMPNEEVYIVNEEGRRVGPGVIGQLVVRGSNVMKGYWDLPEETDKVLKPGAFPGERVLYTGDFFKTDEEGYLYFVGRKDDIIKTRGEKVSPKEVEDVLYSLDGVAEAAVVGVPDAVLGQVIKAVITLREGCPLTEQDLRRHCAQHLEDFAVPRAVEFRDSLPKTTSGKISKRELNVSAEAGR